MDKKDHCEYCGLTSDLRISDALDGETKTLCRRCRNGCKELLEIHKTCTHPTTYGHKGKTLCTECGLEPERVIQ